VGRCLRRPSWLVNEALIGRTNGSGSYIKGARIGCCMDNGSGRSL